VRATTLRRIVDVLLVPLLGCSSVHRSPAERPHEVGAGGNACSASARELEKLAFRQLGEARGHEVLLPELLGSAGGPLADAARELVDVFRATSGEIVWRYRRHDQPLGTIETSFARPFDAPDPVAS